MEFDKSIKTNNVKFEFVKENSDKKDKKTKNKTKNKTKPTGSEGFMSNIKEGFMSEENLKIFEFKLTDFNIFTFIILSVLIPVIGINGIILFHRYASFKTYDWNGIYQNENDDDTGAWYASNIYNDESYELNFKEKNQEGTEGENKTDTQQDPKSDTQQDPKSDIQQNKQKYYTNTKGCNDTTIKDCKNYFATNTNKHKDILFNALDPGFVIKSNYEKGKNPAIEQWGINYGFTSIISSTFDTYRSLIKQFMGNSNSNVDNVEKKYKDYNRKLAESLENNESKHTSDGGDKLGKYFFMSLVYFVIGLILSFLAPIMSFVYGIKNYFNRSDGLTFVNAYIVGKPIGIILAHIMSYFTPLIFLIYTIVFPLIGTKESPSYLNKFYCILKDSASYVPVIVMLNFLLLSTALISLKTSIGVVPGIVAGLINVILILYFGVLKFHNNLNKD